ncbi:alpha/beta hydrolase family protein [Undibacterium sp. Ji50W]|uniref:alpha/beta hydrolase family protein n=1 Tax=Undibacterium sp. Ji50W TaxID=3413041 RepID=UPI003BEFFE1A
MKQVLTTMCRQLSVCAIIAFSLTVPVHAQTPVQEKIPVENFFKISQIQKVQMSPDGKSIGMLAMNKDQRLVLSVMDTATLAPRIVAGYDKTDVVSFYWVNSRRLIFDTNDIRAPLGESRGGNGIFAVNSDGTQFRTLIGNVGDDKARVLNRVHELHSTIGSNETDIVYVVRQTGTRKNPTAALLKLDTVTGRNEVVPTPVNSVDFMMDKSGQARIAVTSVDNLTGIEYKDEKTQQWRNLITFDSIKEDGFVPTFFAPDGQLYVKAHNGQDTTSIYSYDLEKNKIDSTPLVSTKGFDFQGGYEKGFDFSDGFVFNKKQNKLLGVIYETDAGGALWLDEKWKSYQAKIDKALPNTVNTLSGGENSDDEFIVINSHSDIHPASFLIYNTKTDKFTAIGDRKPDVDSKAMSYKDFVRIKVRDGLEIPTYVTIPRNSTGKNLPMVVMVHGGPHLRGVHWDWNAETQFLASRGYVVIEPEFRSSQGYGKALYKAGWKQWGLAMQDDVTDITKWAIEKGYVDPKRICIAGASYGGYAVLMGLIKEPEMYRCGISWVGVTDINLLYDVTWSDTAGTKGTRIGMPILIGDQEKDAAQLKATSPVELASRLTKPLILAYGIEDRRVPLVHGERFKKALPASTKVEWITYTGEGHGWRQLKNNVDFWTRVEKFLEENTAVK